MLKVNVYSSSLVFVRIIKKFFIIKNICSDKPVNKNWKNIGKNTFMGKKQDRYGNRWIWDEDNKEAPLLGVVKPKSITLTGFDKAFEFTKPDDFNSLSEKEKSYYNQLEGVIKKYVDTRNKKLDKDRAFGEWAK